MRWEEKEGITTPNEMAEIERRRKASKTDEMGLRGSRERTLPQIKLSLTLNMSVFYWQDKFDHVYQIPTCCMIIQEHSSI